MKKKNKSTTKGKRMWECECGTLYSQELKECPICKSKKRKKSKIRNFIPIRVKKGDKLIVTHTIGIGKVKKDEKEK